MTEGVIGSFARHSPTLSPVVSRDSRQARRDFAWEQFRRRRGGRARFSDGRSERGIDEPAPDRRRYVAELFQRRTVEGETPIWIESCDDLQDESHDGREGGAGEEGLI